MAVAPLHAALVLAGVSGCHVRVVDVSALGQESKIFSLIRYIIMICVSTHALVYCVSSISL